MNEHVPVWERRFRATTISMPSWSRRAPDRLAFISSESGVSQVHVRDGATGAQRRVTDHPVGAIYGTLTLEGDRVIYWHDETGDEAGQWLVEPFAGGDAAPLLAGVPQGWNGGLSLAPDLVAAVISNADGFSVYVSANGEDAELILRDSDWVGIGGRNHDRADLGGLSADGSMLALEHGDSMHPSLLVIDPRTGSTISEQAGEQVAFHASCWSPRPGDQRLAVIHDRDGDDRPAIWDLASGGWSELDLGLDGPVAVVDWWPDASAALVVHNDEGRDRLFRYGVASQSLEPIEHPPGTIAAARVRPDGDVWSDLSSGAQAPRVIDLSGADVVPVHGERAPDGRPYRSWHFDNGEGDRVHGFYVAPEGEGPFPVMMLVHGGPSMQDTDYWDPEVQAYVDMGFTVGMVDYRGSAGYGREWRDRLIGDIGGPELVDVNAGLADLVARGVADQHQAVVCGWSWGGYVTLLELCKHPDLWLAGVAGIPIADYELLYEDISPRMQAAERALLGGHTPAQVPELMRDRNPINFVARMRAPVMFLIGENDSRCPLRQAMAFVDALRLRDHPHEVVLFGSGHGSNDIDEQVDHVRAIMRFLAALVPGVSIPEGA